MRIILFTFFVLSIFCACSNNSGNSQEKLPTAQFNIDKQKLLVTLRHEEFMNGDGLINRVLSIKYPDNEISNFTIHVAHYSDDPSLKILETTSGVFLIAEDKTGYTVWDLKNKKIAAIKDDMEKNEMVDEPSGSASDFMTHQPLSNTEWKKTLKLTSVKDTDFTKLEWQF